MDERWIRKGWMGTSCCNLFAFSAAVGSQFPLFPPCVSAALLSFPSIRSISLILTYISLTFLPWHHTNEYSIAQHAWEHSVPWLTHTGSPPLGRQRAKSEAHVTLSTVQCTKHLQKQSCHWKLFPCWFLSIYLVLGTLKWLHVFLLYSSLCHACLIVSSFVTTKEMWLSVDILAKLWGWSINSE